MIRKFMHIQKRLKPDHRISDLSLFAIIFSIVFMIFVVYTYGPCLAKQTVKKNSISNANSVLSPLLELLSYQRALHISLSSAYTYRIEKNQYNKSIWTSSFRRQTLCGH